MSQSRIRSFFPAVPDDAYAAQLQRDRDEHAVAREQLLYQQAAMRARHCMEREAGAPRGVGRPRKRRVASISISNSSGCNISTGDIILIDNPVSRVDGHEQSTSSSASSASTPSTATTTASSASPCTTTAPSAATAVTSSSSSAKRPRTDWLAKPELVAQINAAVQLLRSYQAAVTALQRDEKTAGLFDALNESTVRSWYDKRSFTLSQSTAQRLLGHSAPRSGRPPVIRQYPEVEAYVYDAITSIRAANGVVNSTLIASLFRGIVKAKHKELYKKFKFTRRWCRWWFGRTFDWTYKRGSTSGQKLPVDWEVQCANMVKRVSATAAKHKIQHPCFIINWDQTGCVLVPASKYIYSNIKVKQVPIVGHDEKRQITAVVASTLEGEMLPLQLIFTGQDKNKQERRSVPKLNEITTKRVRGWHLTQTYNHWSSLESMKDYIRLIIKPWVDEKARVHNVRLPHVILLIDCWSVHTSKAFREWMQLNYNSYHILFVPANCTSVAQPADVGIQKPFKNVITDAFNAWMADEIHHTVMGGAAAADVRVDLGIKRLKPHMVHWAWSSWDKLTRRQELIKDSWAKCGLSKVLSAETQVDAVLFCVNNAESAPGVEPDQDPEPDSDGEEEIEEGMCDGPTESE